MQTYRDDLWISVFGGGIFCLKNDNSFYHFDSEDGIEDNNVYGMRIDQSGNIWAGNIRGLYCIKENHFKRIKTHSELKGFRKRRF